MTEAMVGVVTSHHHALYFDITGDNPLIEPSWYRHNDKLSSKMNIKEYSHNLHVKTNNEIVKKF